MGTKRISLNFKKTVSVTLLLSTSLLSFNTVASLSKDEFITSSSVSLEHQRELYKQAETAFKAGHTEQFTHLKNQLTEYPLYPYLQLKELGSINNPEQLEQASQFIQRYQDSPVSSRLRTSLLFKLAGKKNWRDYLKLYQPQQSAYLECQYVNALYHEGFVESAFQQVPRLWLVGKSQHKACDSIFDQYSNRGLMTQSLIWQRVDLAMQNNNPRLARFLAKRLSNQEADWVKFWISVHYKPERLYNHPRLRQSHDRQIEIISHAVRRLSRRSPDDGIKLFEYIQREIELPYEEHMRITRTIALSLARKHEPLADRWLDRIPKHMVNQQVSQWRIQNGIRNANWHAVITHIEALPLAQRQKIRWQFWWAYAHRQLNHEIESQEILSRLALKRDYYGFLAADLLNQPYQFENSPIEVDTEQMNQISTLIGIQRAKEFYHLNQLINARREWNAVINEFNDDQLLTVAKIVYEWGWYDRAIAAIGKTSNLNDIEIRFPLAYKDIIEDYSSESQIDTSLTYAIIRRESIFISDARSHKGALGLMQIMPGTARATARAIKTRYRGKRQLIKTRPNIQLGTQYLKMLLGQHQQQTVLATAAYNAGPRNVKKWLPDDEPMDAIRWIETIPYRETREYVTNVLAYKIIYQHRMGQDQSELLHQLMPPVPAKI